MSGLPLIAVSVVLAVIVLAAAAGIGSGARTIGIHVPGIHRDRKSWVRAHRAARWVIVPACALSCILGFLALGAGSTVAGIGWGVWLSGLIVGAVVALATLRRTR